MEQGLICGVDEAGRGPLAGPVVAAAVVLGDNKIAGLDDSKKLSPARREELAATIREECLAYAHGVASVEEIDRYNIRQATMFAMQRAVSKIVICPDLVMVDGDFVPDLPYPAQSLVGGDGIQPEIMAASILAKTFRDAIMKDLCKKHPKYGFAGHKGYGTKKHLVSLFRYGPCPEHRMTFRPVKEAMAA